MTLDRRELSPCIRPRVAAFLSGLRVGCGRVGAVNGARPMLWTVACLALFYGVPTILWGLLQLFFYADRGFVNIDYALPLFALILVGPLPAASLLVVVVALDIFQSIAKVYLFSFAVFLEASEFLPLLDFPVWLVALGAVGLGAAVGFGVLG